MRKETDKSIQNRLIVLGVLTLVILALPWLLTRSLGLLDFTETGQIGDTLGGIMSPFVAILVGYLTFEAFRMQYEANVQHKQDREDQAIKDARVRFDERFYTMLDTFRSNCSEVRCDKDTTGKAAFKVILAELFVTFFVVKEAYLKSKSNFSEELSNYLANLGSDAEEALITRLAYGLFFYGELYNVDDKAEPEFFEILHCIKGQIRNNGDKPEQRFEYYLNHNLKSDDLAKFPRDLFQSHNDHLGHYFRQLYQMTKFLAMADPKIVSEDDKNEYARILRAEMSDYEQALLFYNAMSDRGQAWNSPVCMQADNEYSKLGLLSRFRLIKNIPGNILYRGIDPWTYYGKEERWWMCHNKYFFEQCYILTADDEYNG